MLSRPYQKRVSSSGLSANAQLACDLLHPNPAPLLVEMLNYPPEIFFFQKARELNVHCASHTRTRLKNYADVLNTCLMLFQKIAWILSTLSSAWSSGDDESSYVLLSPLSSYV